MANDEGLDLEFRKTTDVTIAFRVDPEVKKIYDELRVIYDVKNLPNLCKRAITELVFQALKQVKDKAG